MDKKLKELLIKNIYIITCKIYQISTTIIEFIFLKKYKSRSLSLGFTSYLSNFKDFSILYKNDPIEVNQYLSIRKLNKHDLSIIIRSVFTEEYINYLTKLTGYEYSIDFLLIAVLFLFSFLKVK